MSKKKSSMKQKSFMKNTIAHVALTVLALIWIFPILWLVMTSFSGDGGTYASTFFPKTYTLNNYIKLFTETSQFYYGRWFLNTLMVAVCSCILSTFLVLGVSYAISRLRFKMRKPYMNLALILGMFPGFMSMIAIYYILKGINMTQSLLSLILVYSGGAGLSFYIAKGFFDTIPKSIDEAAWIDGATKWNVFTRITIPLSKPIIIYTILTTFMAPWADYIFVSVIMGDNYDNYTIALGLFKMIDKHFINTWYHGFMAGAVIVSIPIAILFIIMQRYYVDGISGAVKG